MLRPILHTFLADFKDRVRRRNYIVSLLLMCIVTALFFPSKDDGYNTILIAGYRGIYNAHWMGATLAVLSATFLPVICFYLIKNAVEGDRKRGACELIAATAVTKTQYIVGKWLANAALLLGLSLAMTVALFFVQQWHGESREVALLPIVTPQILLVLPMLLVIASAALLFESIPLLRGGIGNVVYFFVWMSLVIYAVEGGSGVGMVVEQMAQDIKAFAPQSEGGVYIGISTSGDEALRLFTWQGMEYLAVSWGYLLSLLAVSFVLLALAVVFFDRFNNNKAVVNTTENSGKLNALAALLFNPLSALFAKASSRWAFTRLVRQECLLLLRGEPNWWYLAILALAVVQLLLPLEVVRFAILPTSWLLCVLVFSGMGHRELSENAEQLVFSSANVLGKPFIAQLSAGFVVALMVVSPAFVRFAVSGELTSAMMLLSGALFIPSFAMACGALTNTSRTFEILFTVVWYAGPVQRSMADFIGINPQLSAQQQAPMMFLLTSIALIGLGYLGRLRQRH